MNNDNGVVAQSRNILDKSLATLQAGLDSAKAALAEAAKEPSAAAVTSAMQLPLVLSGLETAFATGRPFADGAVSGEPASVIVINAEDGVRDTIQGRLCAAGAEAVVSNGPDFTIARCDVVRRERRRQGRFRLAAK